MIVHRGTRIENPEDILGVVGARHVLAGDLGPAADLNTNPITTPMTRPNDVIFLPEGAETGAVVDETGGHLLEAPLVAIEIDSHEEGLTPVLVAAWLNSEETRSLATGSTLQRISLRHVTLPVFEPETAHLLTESVLAVQRDVASAQRLFDAASALRSQVLRGLTAGVVATAPAAQEPQ